MTPATTHTPEQDAVAITNLILALEAVRDFYQQAFAVMPVAFQTIDNLCEEAIASAEYLVQRNAGPMNDGSQR